jgi:hypothetical protein
MPSGDEQPEPHEEKATSHEEPPLRDIFERVERAKNRKRSELAMELGVPVDHIKIEVTI